MVQCIITIIIVTEWGQFITGVSKRAVFVTSKKFKLINVQNATQIDL